MPIYERLRQAMAPAGNDPRLDAFLGYGLHLAAETLVQLAPAKAAQAMALDKIVDLAEFVAQNWNAIPDEETGQDEQEGQDSEKTRQSESHPENPVNPVEVPPSDPENPVDPVQNSPIQTQELPPLGV